MASPATMHIHGTADSLHDISDEPSTSSVLDVEEFKFAFARERRERRNNHGNFRRLEYFNPLLTISLTAFITTASGLAVQEVGTRVTALANFAAERRGMDPTAGTMILEDTEDTLSLSEDTKTSMQILHAPFVVTA